MLLQFWLRVDEKLMRVYDTRVFHEFGKDFVVREQIIREDSFDSLAQRGMPRTASLYTDPSVVARRLTVQSTTKEKIWLTPVESTVDAAAGTGSNETKPTDAAAPTTK